MTNIEKAIKALESCLQPPTDEEKQNYICARDECPYFREYSAGKCIYALMRDALEIIKETQFCKPIMRSEHAHGGREEWYECNECGAYLGMYYGEKKVCKCGRKVAWNV